MDMYEKQSSSAVQTHVYLQHSSFFKETLLTPARLRQLMKRSLIYSENYYLGGIKKEPKGFGDWKIPKETMITTFIVGSWSKKKDISRKIGEI